MSDLAVPAQVSTAGNLWPRAFEPQVWEVCVLVCEEKESSFEAQVVLDNSYVVTKGVKFEEGILSLG